MQPAWQALLHDASSEEEEDWMGWGPRKMGLTSGNQYVKLGAVSGSVSLTVTNAGTWVDPLHTSNGGFWAVLRSTCCVSPPHSDATLNSVS